MSNNNGHTQPISGDDKISRMDSPTFDRNGDPTDATLAAIASWEPDYDVHGNPWKMYIQFCREAWNMEMGAIREELDEDGKTLLCFVSGGWSANEAVLNAMQRNLMFNAMCWHSSYRGGLVKYSMLD
jgi:hypothetical protein